MRTQSKNRQLVEARENASDQIATGFSFAYDRLIWWHEFPWPITKQSKIKTRTNQDPFQYWIKNSIHLSALGKNMADFTWFHHRIWRHVCQIMESLRHIHQP